MRLGFHPECKMVGTEITALLACSRSISKTHRAITLGLSDSYLDLTCSKKDFPELGLIVRGIVKGNELVCH